MKSSTVSGPRSPCLVGPRRADQPGDLGRHQLGLLVGLGGAAVVVGLRANAARCRTRWSGRAQSGWLREPALVDLLGDEPADVGVHAPGLGQEHAAVVGHRHVVAEHVLEHAVARRRSGCTAWATCGSWSGRRAARGCGPTSGRGQRIGQRQLAGLVDEQHVDGRGRHVLAGEQPRRAGDEVELVLGARPVARDVLDVGQSASRGSWARREPRADRSSSPASVNTSTISSSRLSMAWWLMAVIPTRRPAPISARTMCAAR